jgi:hypothetical protein
MAITSLPWAASLKAGWSKQDVFYDTFPAVGAGYVQIYIPIEANLDNKAQLVGGFLALQRFMFDTAINLYATPSSVFVWAPWDNVCKGNMGSDNFGASVPAGSLSVAVLGSFGNGVFSTGPASAQIDRLIEIFLEDTKEQ